MLAIKSLKRRFRFGEVIIVADSGVPSKDDLANLDEKFYKYIVAAKLKNLSKDKQAEVFDLSRYKSIREGDDALNT